MSRVLTFCQTESHSQLSDAKYVRTKDRTHQHVAECCIRLAFKLRLWDQSLHVQELHSFGSGWFRRWRVSSSAPPSGARRVVLRLGLLGVTHPGTAVGCYQHAEGRYEYFVVQHAANTHICPLPSDTLFPVVARLTERGPFWSSALPADTAGKRFLDSNMISIMMQSTSRAWLSPLRAAAAMLAHPRKAGRDSAVGHSP